MNQQKNHLNINREEKKLRTSHRKSDVVLVISTGNLFGSCLIYRPCNFIYFRSSSESATKMMMLSPCFHSLLLLSLSSNGFFRLSFGSCVGIFRFANLPCFWNVRTALNVHCRTWSAHVFIGFFVAIIQTYLISYTISECWFILKGSIQTVLRSSSKAWSREKERQWRKSDAQSQIIE